MTLLVLWLLLSTPEGCYDSLVWLQGYRSVVPATTYEQIAWRLCTI